MPFYRHRSRVVITEITPDAHPNTQDAIFEQTSKTDSSDEEEPPVAARTPISV